MHNPPSQRRLRPIGTTRSTDGQIVIPAPSREADGLAVGEQFEIERVGPSTYRLTGIGPPANAGVVEWLRSCPDHKWFTSLQSESTDTL